MALGTAHTCIELATNAIECLGTDADGEHGDGAAVPAATAWSGPAVGTLSDVDELVSGAYHLCALKTGVVHCWGYGGYGQIGVGSTTNATAPVPVTGLSGVDDITAGGNHSCAVIDGQVACWGDNQYQQLGVPSPSYSAFALYVPGITTAVAVHAGSQHTCIELQNGEIRCFGYGQDGRLGYGSSIAETATPQLVTGSTGFGPISLGGTRTCAVLSSSGNVSCWGGNVLSPTPITW
jgi:alpha-tubulin suppressor-like RCC1 family protein